MKPIVYIDILFMINFLMNSIIIYSTSQILSHPIHILRLALAATVSALYSTIMFFPQLSLLYSMIFKLIFFVIIVRISFNANSIMALIKNTAAFLAVNALFGGITFLLVFLTDFGITMGTVISNGELYFNISIGTLTFSAAIAYISVYILSYIKKCNITRDKNITNIKLSLFDKSISVKAFADTGCMAQDPLTHSPVIILREFVSDKIIPQEFLEAINNNFSRETDGKYLRRYRVIPYNTVESKGFMNGFVADNVQIDNVELKNVVIGIAKYSVSSDYSFDALFNPNIIKITDKEKNLC